MARLYSPNGVCVYRLLVDVSIPDTRIEQAETPFGVYDIAVPAPTPRPGTVQPGYPDNMFAPRTAFEWPWIKVYRTAEEALADPPLGGEDRPIHELSATFGGGFSYYVPEHMRAQNEPSAIWRDPRFTGIRA